MKISNGRAKKRGRNYVKKLDLIPPANKTTDRGYIIRDCEECGEWPASFRNFTQTYLCNSCAKPKFMIFLASLVTIILIFFFMSIQKPKQIRTIKKLDHTTINKSNKENIISIENF
jgi:hypothetical protein